MILSLSNCNVYIFITVLDFIGSIMTLGDIVAQLCVDKKGLEHYDVYRTIRFTILGSCVVVSILFVRFEHSINFCHEK